MSDSEGEMPITSVVVAVFVVIALLGWGFLAGSYDGAHSPKMSEMSEEELKNLDQRSLTRARRSGFGRFIGNAIEQLPNLPTVVSWHFSNRAWLPILFLVLEAGVVGGGFWMKRVERSLSQPRRRRRR